ncbi:hypothetical protein B9Z19DRAFT_1194475 [Tuber borchii]|uniref:Uncharacterized protein n=1 Tax=Tuber borchii TaxID=42251 RepID=A0A2T6ZMS8_TUBBO|nr:hypothetical protein B9Z19DRAFT_1194475 [Tuber borchii]
MPMPTMPAKFTLQAGGYPAPPDSSQTQKAEGQVDSEEICSDSSQTQESEGPVDSGEIPPDSSQLGEAERPVDSDESSSDSSQTQESAGALDNQYYLTEGLDCVEHIKYIDISSFKGAVNTRVGEFCVADNNESSSPSPYLIFSPVTLHQLARIDSERKIKYKTVRTLYLTELETLIIKIMPLPEHEITTHVFERMIIDKVLEGGQRAMIIPAGSTRFPGLNNSNEAAASLRPCHVRPRYTDWPSVVLETGVSETAERLHVDGRWWFANSGGAVKIVLLFFVNLKASSIKIELWKEGTVRNQQQTRVRSAVTSTGPTLQKTVNLTPNAITGAPIKLRFHDIFLRNPRKELGEPKHYHITEDDLSEYYKSVWPPSLDIISPAEPYCAGSASSDGYIED